MNLYETSPLTQATEKQVLTLYEHNMENKTLGFLSQFSVWPYVRLYISLDLIYLISKMKQVGCNITNVPLPLGMECLNSVGTILSGTISRGSLLLTSAKSKKGIRRSTCSFHWGRRYRFSFLMGRENSSQRVGDARIVINKEENASSAWVKHTY